MSGQYRKYYCLFIFETLSFDKNDHVITMQLFLKIFLIDWRDKSQQEKGMTLIELLVVILIIGILATIALPSLLTQVGKARESEARVQLGALNRAQQAYFVEKGAFVDDAGQMNLLDVPVANTTYYTFSIVDEAVQQAIGNDNANNGTRDYLGAVQFSSDTGSYRGIICRSINAATAYSLTNTDVFNAGVTLSSNALGCNSTNAEEIK